MLKTQLQVQSKMLSQVCLAVFVNYFEGAREGEQEKDYLTKVKILEELELIKKNIKKLSPKDLVKIIEIEEQGKAGLIHNTSLFHYT